MDKRCKESIVIKKLSKFSSYFNRSAERNLRLRLKLPQNINYKVLEVK